MNVFTEWLAVNFDEVSPHDFYRVIFPVGELDTRASYTKGKYVGIIVEITGRKKSNGQPHINRYSITDDLDTVDMVCGSDNFCLCGPLSYAGNKRSADAARNLYAIAVDVDHIRMRGGYPQGLVDLWHGHVVETKRLPKPTFIVSSGSGVHLYYVLERAVPLFENVAKQLQKMKRELTAKIWNEGIVDIADERDIQQEGIYQGFRMPGTITKGGDRARAFRTGDKVSLEYLNGFVSEKNQVTEYVYKSSLRLSEAKEKYPDWYERRIEKGEPRGVIAYSRAVYDNWKKRILSEAKVGHRYYCLMTLSMYAKKCSFKGPRNHNPVTREELEQDCFEIMDYFEKLTTDEDNHFTEADVLDALEAFDERWITYPRGSISYRTGIVIEPQKRNGRKQKTHLRIARSNKAILKEAGELKHPDGRPPAEKIVSDYIIEHPEDCKSAVARGAGVSRPTVDKYWLSGHEAAFKSVEREVERAIDMVEVERRMTEEDGRTWDDYRGQWIDENYWDERRNEDLREIPHYEWYMGYHPSDYQKR